MGTPTDQALLQYQRTVGAMKQLLAELPAELAWPPEVHFRRHGVQPPVWEYITKDDFLAVSIYTTTATTGLKLSLRYMEPGGRIQYQTESLDGVPASTLTTKLFPLSEGFLVSAVVSNLGGGLADSTCFVALALQFGSQSSTAPHTLLAQGYVSNLFSVEWPPSPVRGVGGGASSSFTTPLSVGVSNPAAGADWTYTTPATYLLVGIQATLATSATVANRTANFIIDDGTNTLALWDAGSTQGNSTTVDYVAGIFGSAGTLVSPPNVYSLGLTKNYPLAPGWRVRTSTNNIQTGDQWSAIRLCVLS